ncbi:MAG: long-chain fatty acid--CoA ligase [Treponema sp.]|nr:long-chain fatty acid--CoA ligase [Treponema sp.]
MEQTLPLMIRSRAGNTPDIIIQYYKDKEGKYHSITYRQFYENVRYTAAGLMELGVRRGDTVGLISDNRREWMVTDFGILSTGAADVPRGCDITLQELTYILGFTGCALVFAENEKQIQKILSCRKELPAIKTLITFEPAGSETKEAAAKEGIEILLFGDVMELGKKREIAHPGGAETEMDKGGGEDTATIIFTSGTTGEPKGVVLSHRNFLCQMPAFRLFFEIKEGDIWLSMLPVWHVYERVVEYAIFYYGTTIAYSKIIASVLMEDFLTIKPNWMVSVPRAWEAIMDSINRQIKSMGGFTKKMFDIAVSLSMIYTYYKDLTFGLIPRFHRRARFLDSLFGFLPWLLFLPVRGLAQIAVFNRIKKKFGGRFRAGISGGGSLPAETDLFFNSIGIRLQEAYGLTETAPLVSVRQFKKSRRGTIGQLLPGTEVKILANQERDTAETPRYAGNPLPPGHNGIIYVRGAQVMKGYYKKEEATSAVLSEDGWFNTGDIGMLTYDNELRITGRAKDTIVIRSGENVEPVPIECKLRESPYIMQCMVAGQDQKNLAALIVPRQQAVMDFAEENAIPIVDYDLLLQQPEINAIIASEIADRVCSKAGFRPYERIYKFILLPKPFETGKELSGKGELLRSRITALYAKEIQKLFNNG